MLRYDRFTGGKLWVEEYGSAGESSQFPFLLAYSPLHNLKAGTCYPATLVTTADHDDRVVPSHSFKYTAALQAAQGCARAALIRVEVAGSHNYRPTDRLIAERADQWAFAGRGAGRPHALNAGTGNDAAPRGARIDTRGATAIACACLYACHAPQQPLRRSGRWRAVLFTS